MRTYKRLSKQQRKLVRIVARKIAGHPLVLPVVVFLLLFVISAIGFVNLNAQTIGASDARVVQIYDDGKEQIVPTRASTVGDLLRRLNIQIREYDIVEPAIETEIIEDDFRVNIYRARPVVIIDGTIKITTLSAAALPKDVAEKAGITVYPEDKLVTEVTENVLRDGIGQRIVINRASLAYINFYGTLIPVRTHAKTVGEVLEEKAIKPVEGDTLQPSPETPITPNIQIFIMRLGRQVETKEEVIPAPVETILDPGLIDGTRIIKEPGSPGRKLVTYEIELRNNKETSRRVLQEVIAAEPVKQVVVKGTKVVYSNPSANVELGRQIAEEMGVGSQFGCLYNLFERESRWNHLARNRNSGAYGIPQALPGSKMGPGWENDPAVQIRWGIGYTNNRYGGPCGAWNFWQINRWY